MLREPDEPLEFTEFETSTDCEPTAEYSNLQVIQAFVTAYNDRDLDRLRGLVSESVTIADMSGIPHLGEDDWTGVTRWAEAGWSVDDRFALTRLVMYDSWSVFEVEGATTCSDQMGLSNSITPGRPTVPIAPSPTWFSTCHSRSLARPSVDSGKRSPTNSQRAQRNTSTNQKPARVRPLIAVPDDRRHPTTRCRSARSRDRCVIARDLLLCVLPERCHGQGNGCCEQEHRSQRDVPDVDRLRLVCRRGMSA